MSAVPLLAGDAGVAQTIELMRRLIDEATKDPSVNRLAVEILKNSGAPQHDPLAEAEAIYAWVHANIRFVNDPVDSFGDPKETLRAARDILELGAGDCDDFTILMLSLAQNIGLQGRIVTVASDPRDPSQFTHVYPEVDIDGEWVPMDAARPGAEFGLAPARVYRKKEWNAPGLLAGLAGLGRLGHVPQRRFPLSGYTQMRPLRKLPMGDDASDISSVITAAGTEVANDLLAVNAAPQNIQGTVSTSATGSPAISPYAGYSLAQLQAMQSGSLLGTPSTEWMLIGFGIIGLVLFFRVTK